MSAKNRERDSARDRARKNAAGIIRQAPAWTPETLAAAVTEGQRDALAQAITWVESTLPEHQPRIESLLHLTSAPRNSLRIGFTGIPGVGKSTLIERFGLEALRRGWRVAVLAVDPSSQRTGGSLLGDKTRMTDLSKHTDAFVRPSAASGTLGGVARATSEAIQLCEAAGYNLILVETVGVGQSEVAVRSMVDMFCLLLIGGAGDDVQGIKRGVVEMADFLVVHKAEQERLAACQDTAQAYRHALHVFGQPPSGTPVEVLLASSLTGEGHEAIWEHVASLKATWMNSGWWNEQRELQRLDAFQRHARQLLVEAHMHRESESWKRLETEVAKGDTSPFAAARRWVQLNALGA